MPSIGGVNFLSVRREPSPPGEAVVNVTRPGVDGIALKKVGFRGETYRLVAVADKATTAARRQLIDDSVALKGTIVTVVDDFGETWADVAVVRVVPSRSKGIDSAVGGLAGTAAKIMQWIDFECVDTAAGP